MEREPNMKGIRAGKIRFRLAFPYARFKNAVHALTGAFYKTATRKGLGYATVARRLLPKDILGCNARRESARTDNLQPAWILTDKYRAGKTIVAVADSVQDRFADSPLIKSQDIPDKQAVLKVLLVIPKIYKLPQVFIKSKETLPELFSLLSRSSCIGRAILEDDFGLREKAAHCLSCTKENHGSIRKSLACKQTRHQ